MDADEQMKEMHLQHMEKYSISQDQIAEIKECYALFDKNDEGVPIENIGDVLRAMGQNPTVDQCKTMIDEAEGQGQNGNLTLDEFMSIAAPKLKPESEMEDDLEQAFKCFDKLDTGYVDADELRSMLGTLGEPLDEDDLNEFIKHGDPDKKNRILIFDFMKKLAAK